MESLVASSIAVASGLVHGPRGTDLGANHHGLPCSSHHWKANLYRTTLPEAFWAGCSSADRKIQYSECGTTSRELTPGVRDAVEAKDNIRIPVRRKIEGEECILVVNKQGERALHSVSVQQRPYRLIAFELVSCFVCLMHPFLSVDALGLAAAAVEMSTFFLGEIDRASPMRYDDPAILGKEIATTLESAIPSQSIVVISFHLAANPPSK